MPDRDRFHRLSEKIAALKERRRAVILAHSYQPGEVQDIADMVGDSLGLCLEAAKTTAETIVFCGVHFMAESAKLLNPSRRVLFPTPDAGCPMADMAEEGALRRRKAELGNPLVVCYVNSTAAVKAESDICCTSSNAERVVNSLPADREILFVPDRHLGSWVAERTGRTLHYWQGYCPTHQRLVPEELTALRDAHPGSALLVHPECAHPVREVADYVGSTEQIVYYAGAASGRTFLIGTESGILHRLRKLHPQNTYIEASELLFCTNMKKTSLEAVAQCLEVEAPVIHLDPALAERALLPLQRMLDLERGN